MGWSVSLMFKAFDKDNDGMLTLAEFTEGVNLILDISPVILTKIFGFMDVLKIGMIDP